MKIEELRKAKWGFHLDASDYHITTEQLREAQEMHCSIVTVLDLSPRRNKELGERGFLVLNRPMGDLEYDWALDRLGGFVADCVTDTGYCYVQIRNEIPGSNTEADKFCEAAQVILDAGGVPFVGCVWNDELWGFLDKIAGRKGAEFLTRCGVVTHCYDFGHPWNYPYDAINQSDHPRATIYDDWTSVFGFIKTNQVIEDWFVANRLPIEEACPIIVGEGGPVIDDEFAYKDKRYGYPDSTHHLVTAKHIVEALNVRQVDMVAAYAYDGIVTHHIPDKLLGYCFWLLADNRGESYPNGIWPVPPCWESRQNWNSESWFPSTPPKQSAALPGYTITFDTAASREYLKLLSITEEETPMIADIALYTAWVSLGGDGTREGFMKFLGPPPDGIGKPDYENVEKYGYPTNGDVSDVLLDHEERISNIEQALGAIRDITEPFRLDG